jgi:hypothetical protein
MFRNTVLGAPIMSLIGACLLMGCARFACYWAAPEHP